MRIATLLSRPARPWAPKLALAPTLLAGGVCFYGCLLWTVMISFTPSRLLPVYRSAGLLNYRRLFSSLRWNTAYTNMLLYGASFVLLTLALGAALAVLLDRKLRAASMFRGIFLLPMSLSFIVTGLAWQWLLNPGVGLQHFVRDLGWLHFSCDWITDPARAIFAVAIAAAWHAAGLVMLLTLASLRAVDPNIWHAARIDGIPAWRVYWHILLPMARPALLTAAVLLIELVIKTYDLVIAMTHGGPGGTTDLPSLFVVDFSFHRASLGVAAAGAVVMLATALAALAPLLYLSRRRA
jgi:glucose/mannose transport system permease protein